MSEDSGHGGGVPVIMPVGKALGAHFAFDARPGDEPECYQVHIGETVEHLTHDEWTVWELAHQRVFRHRVHAFSRKALSGVVEQKSELGGGDEVIDDLIERGVLASVDLRGAERDDFLKRYRLIPTAAGVGGRSEEPTRIWLSLAGVTMLDLGHLAFSVWAFSYMDGSVWRGAQELWAPKGMEPSSPDAFTLEEILAAIAEELPGIVASGCGYLERLP